MGERNLASTTRTPAANRVDRWTVGALIFSLGFDKLVVVGRANLTDLLFFLLLTRMLPRIVQQPGRLAGAGAIGVGALCYLLGLVPSAFASAVPADSLLKLATVLYLVLLGGGIAVLVRDRDDLVAALRAWAAALAVMGICAGVGLVLFAVAPNSPALAWLSFSYGTLPAGAYPRLSLTFLNGNMACAFLTCGIAVLCALRLAGALAWGRLAVLLGATGLAAATTLSPGLGGVVLALGIGGWLLGGRTGAGRLGLWVGIALAAAVVPIAAWTPFPHATAGYAWHLPGGVTLYPSGRMLTWAAAWREFLHAPLIGHGIGVDAVGVAFVTPNGSNQFQTDAHNAFLNIAAQAGAVGLAGMLALIAAVAGVARRTIADRPVTFVLAAGWLNVFAYQGIAGSYEDARFLWVLAGLVAAAARGEGAGWSLSENRASAGARARRGGGSRGGRGIAAGPVSAP